MRELKPKYSIELIEFRTPMGPDIAKLNGYKKVVEWDAILPLLREARMLIKRAHGIVYGHPEPYSSFLNDAQAFLDATAAIEEEKV